MAAKNAQQESFEQTLTQKRNTVLELELNARYWKAQYELKHYTIEENKLREAYNDIIQAKQSLLEKIDEEVKAIEEEQVMENGLVENQTERVTELDEQGN